MRFQLWALIAGAPSKVAEAGTLGAWLTDALTDAIGRGAASLWLLDTTSETITKL